MSHRRRARSPTPLRYMEHSRSRDGESSHRSADDTDRSRRQSSDYQRKTDPKATQNDEMPRQHTDSFPPYPPSPVVSRQVTSAPPPQVSLSIPSRPLTFSQPPLPPPEIPSILPVSSAPPPPLLTREEKESIWIDRIKLLADSVRASEQHDQLKENIAVKSRGLMETSRSSSLGDDEKQRLKAELADLEAQRSEIQKRLNNNTSRLAESGGWPAGPRPEVEEGEVEKHRDTMKHVEELKATAAKMKSLLNDIRAHKYPMPGESDSPMDIGSPEGSSRPSKRRRLSDGMHSTQTHGQPSGEEVEMLHEKITSIEGRFSTFENDLNAHDAELRDELYERIEAKFEEFQLVPASDIPAEHSNDRYLKVEQNINATGEQVGEMAEELGNLILKANTQETEAAAIRRDIDQSKEDFVLLQKRFQGYVEAREKDVQAIAALKAALAAHKANMNRPLSPPSSPRIPTHDYILATVEAPLLDSVRTNVRPLIEDLRSDIENMLRNQNKEMYDTVWSKLLLTRRMAEAISERIEKEEDNTAPA